MTIENVRCETKKEKVSSQAPEQVVWLNIIVTVRNGDELIDIPIKDEINRIFDIAIARANEHIEKSKTGDFESLLFGNK